MSSETPGSAIAWDELTKEVTEVTIETTAIGKSHYIPGGGRSWMGWPPHHAHYTSIWIPIAASARLGLSEYLKEKPAMDEHENCQVEPIEKALDEAALAEAEAAILAVYGMGCPRCAMRVRNGLLSLDGVLLAEVFLERGAAAVAYDPKKITVASLEEAVAAAGNDGRHNYQARFLTNMPADEAFTITA